MYAFLAFGGKVRAMVQWNLFAIAAFTLKGFYGQDRNLTVVKTNLQVLKLKFHACNFKQALYYPLHKLYIAW